MSKAGYYLAYKPDNAEAEERICPGEELTVWKRVVAAESRSAIPSISIPRPNEVLRIAAVETSYGGSFTWVC